MFARDQEKLRLVFITTSLGMKPLASQARVPGTFEFDDVDVDLRFDQPARGSPLQSTEAHRWMPPAVQRRRGLKRAPRNNFATPGIFVFEFCV